jgi:hypothetical protein
MNEKCSLNEAMLVLTVQSCFWKNLNFFTLAPGSGMVVRSRRESGTPRCVSLASPGAWVWHGYETQMLGSRSKYFLFDSYTKHKHFRSSNHSSRSDLKHAMLLVQILTDMYKFMLVQWWWQSWLAQN